MKRRIVVYGTSLSAESTWFWRRTGGSWVRGLRSALGGLDGGEPAVLDRARWGSDSDWGLRRLHSRVLNLAPDLVTLEFAVNDADRRRSISLDRSRRNLERMTDEIASALPGCGVVLLTTNPVFGSYRTERPRLEDYYDACRSVAHERGLPLVDLHARWVDALRDEAARKVLLPDGIHPSAEGCERVVVPAVLEACRRLLARGEAQDRVCHSHRVGRRSSEEDA